MTTWLVECERCGCRRFYGEESSGLCPVCGFCGVCACCRCYLLGCGDCPGGGRSEGESVLAYYARLTEDLEFDQEDLPSAVLEAEAKVLARLADIQTIIDQRRCLEGTRAEAADHEP